MHMASDRPAGDPGLPSGPLCLAWALGIKQMWTLESNPSFVQFLKIYFLSPVFPTMVRQCVKGSDQR